MSNLDKGGVTVPTALHEKINAEFSKNDPRKLFSIASMQDSMDATQLEPRRALVGDFLHEREIALCVGQTGVGKSVLFLQVLNQIACGATPGQHYGLECAAPPQKVLYMDFENDVEEWKVRLGGMRVSENLFRADFSAEAQAAPTADEMVEAILHHIRKGGRVEGCKVIGIDNITYLFDGSQRDMHEESIQLFKLLNRVRKEYGVTFLIAAHRNKGDVHALELGSVSGSSKNIQFVQSVFGIAAAAGDGDTTGRVYLKQLKVRNRPAKWTSGNVLTAELMKYNGALQVVTSKEVYNERALLEGTGKSIRASILELLVEDPELSGGQIAEILGSTKRQNVNKHIREGSLREEARKMRGGDATDSSTYQQELAPF